MRIDVSTGYPSRENIQENHSESASGDDDVGFIDEEYEDQETILQSDHYEDIDPLSDFDAPHQNSQNQHIGLDFGTDYEHPRAIQQIPPDMAVDSSTRYNLIHSLNLDIPESGNLIRHHVYRLPVTRSQDITHHLGSLSDVAADSADTSRKRSKFFSRINPFKKKN